MPYKFIRNAIIYSPRIRGFLVTKHSLYYLKTLSSWKGGGRPFGKPHRGISSATPPIENHIQQHFTSTTLHPYEQLVPNKPVETADERRTPVIAPPPRFFRYGFPRHNEISTNPLPPHPHRDPHWCSSEQRVFPANHAARRSSPLQMPLDSVNYRRTVCAVSVGVAAAWRATRARRRLQ